VSVNMPPVVSVSGEVRRVYDRDFANEETGVVRHVREFVLATREGFARVKCGDELPLPAIGDQLTLDVELSTWARDGRHGLVMRRSVPVVAGK